jgi:hypothetical protein
VVPHETSTIPRFSPHSTAVVGRVVSNWVNGSQRWKRLSRLGQTPHRAPDVWACADYMERTGEAKKVSAVSGASPLQASAWCKEHLHQQAHSRKYVNEDEISGPLEKSLLAWTFDGEVVAAKYAMNWRPSV